MINPQLKSRLKQLVREYDDDLSAIADQLKAQWKSQSPKADTVDETMYNVGHQEGRCEGVTLFLDELQRIAASND